MSFAGSVMVLGNVPQPVRSPGSGAQEFISLEVAEEDEMDMVEETTDSTDTPPAIIPRHPTIIPPPPGFSHGHMRIGV